MVSCDLLRLNRAIKALFELAGIAVHERERRGVRLQRNPIHQIWRRLNDVFHAVRADRPKRSAAARHWKTADRHGLHLHRLIVDEGVSDFGGETAFTSAGIEHRHGKIICAVRI